MDEMAGTISRTGQYLSFTLDGESFAIDVARIREIIDHTHLTRIPRMPGFVRGVINLRGSVVPVVDLCMKLDMGTVEETVDSCIVVLEVVVDGEATVVGAFVDAVEEVFELDSSSMEPPPRMGTRLDTALIESMGRRGDDLLILLDVDGVFSAEEIRAVRSVSHDPAEAPGETPGSGE